VEKKANKITGIFAWVTVYLIIIPLSLSHTASLYQNYSAPLYAYHDLSYELSMLKVEDKDVNICIGKEFHRFPGSFFFPGKRFKLRILDHEDSFKGPIPHYYSDTNTKDKESSKYMPLNRCHYVIDQHHFKSEKDNLYPPNYWEEIISYPYIDRERSSTILRSYYIPLLSHQANSWSNYYVLKRK